MSETPAVTRVQSVRVGGTTVRYWHIDRGSPDTMLILHGLGGDHRGLLDLAQLIPSVSIVLPDLPGYGESEPLPEPHTLAAYARFVADLRTELNLDGCHLLGHSLGASIALVHAAEPSGQDLSSLFLLNPVSQSSTVTAGLGKLYYRAAAHAPARIARIWLASRPAVYIADAFVLRTRDRQRRRLILAQDYENYRRASVPAMIESFLSYYDTPFDDLAAKVTAPTLLLAAGRDTIAPVPAVARLAEQIPAGHLAVIADGGHLLPTERPADVAGLVNAFIDDPETEPRATLTVPGRGR